MRNVLGYASPRPASPGRIAPAVFACAGVGASLGVAGIATLYAASPRDTRTASVALLLCGTAAVLFFAGVVAGTVALWTRRVRPVQGVLGIAACVVIPLLLFALMATHPPG